MNMSAQGTIEEVISKTIAVLQANLSKGISIGDLSKAVGYSQTHLRRIFGKATGKGLLQFLMELRIEKAKQLLRETNLHITEIALGTGFGDSSHFSKAFRESEGITASAFREAIRKAGQSPISNIRSNAITTRDNWFQDIFTGSLLNEAWKVLGGTAEMQGAWALLGAVDSTTLGLDLALPENFRITFEVWFLKEGSKDPYLHLSLTDSTFKKNYCAVEAGAHGNTLGKISRGRLGGWQLGIQWSTKAVLIPGKWHAITLEFREDTIEFTMDGNSLFRCRDPFPPIFSSRSRFAIGGWQSPFQLRNFRVEDLGFTPFVRTIRQGDMLYNEGLYAQAREFYTRHLSSSVTSSDSVELDYKIGMCLLKDGYYAQACLAMAKVAAFPQTNFWSQLAGLAALEITWKSGEFDIFLSEIRRNWAIPALRNGIREIVETIFLELSDRGFLEKCYELEKTLLVLEEKGSAMRPLILQLLADNYLYRRFYPEAILTIAEIRQNPTAAISVNIFSSITLADAYAHQGRFGESEEVLRQAREKHRQEGDLARFNLLSAANLRGQGKYQEAMDLLDKISANENKDTLGLRAFALVQRAFMLTGLNRIQEACRAIASADAIIPGYGSAEASYVVELVRGNYDEAAEQQLTQSHQEGAPAKLAPFAVKSGILFEMGGNPKKAREIWQETIRRFPVSYCRYYAALSESLLTGSQGVLEKMPFSLFSWTEMLYFGGLLFESRGEMEYARSLFELIVKEDPTRRWPAVLAAKKLEA